MCFPARHEVFVLFWKWGKESESGLFLTFWPNSFGQTSNTYLTSLTLMGRAKGATMLSRIFYNPKSIILRCKKTKSWRGALKSLWLLRWSERQGGNGRSKIHFSREIVSSSLKLFQVFSSSSWSHENWILSETVICFLCPAEDQKVQSTDLKPGQQTKIYWYLW